MSLTISGANETSAWLGRIKAGIQDAVKEELTGSTALSEMDAAAKQIVNTVVYLAYSPVEYQRTLEFLNAVGAVALESSPPAAGIVIELTPGIVANDGKGDVSYARFMLPEYAEKSWLARTVPQTLPRDFLTAWQQYFADQIPAKLSQAIDGALRK